MEIKNELERVKVGDIVMIPHRKVVVILSLEAIDDKGTETFLGANYCYIKDYKGLLESKSVGRLNSDLHPLGSNICVLIGKANKTTHR